METDHLLIYAPKDWDKRLKDLGTLLEKQYDQAKSALGYDDKTDPFPAKATVFVFGEREQFTAFVRRVDKQRLDSDDAASFNGRGRRAARRGRPGAGEVGPRARTARRRSSWRR